MQKRLFAIIVFLFCGTALAEVCPKCKAVTLQTDAFCAECGFDMSGWRNSRMRQPKQPSRVVQERPEQTSSTQVKWGHEPLCPSAICKDSGLVTPIKLALFGPCGVPNDIECTVAGLDLGILGDQVYAVDGIAIGGIGLSHRSVSGFSVAGFFNQVHCMDGLQIGLVNVSDEMHGLQVGLINAAGSACGVQIGAFNGIGRGDECSVLPVINMQF